MAAPTSVISYEPSLTIAVSGSNVDAGNNDYRLGNIQAGLSHGFSIVTGTLTAMTVTVLLQNLEGTLIDKTYELFGVNNLASSDVYVCDIPLSVKDVVVRAARSNATNAINFTIKARKR